MKPYGKYIYIRLLGINVAVVTIILVDKENISFEASLVT
jgi:hypothetical protein